MFIMKSVQYGRKMFSMSEGETRLESTSIIERTMLGEDEDSFIYRLKSKYKRQRGTIEIVFKKGRPDYAIITLS